ncbi:hypothetical protein [Corynebacterium glutamicum]|uniref:hypothetical protein n=1 Tax=Corynebacterium glutamicum TaxID=1718 RepID=UPI0009BE8C3A|nr:hypothetical protein [Corynebacterium glutamicum]
MNAVKVRTGVPALVRSKEMVTCILFVLMCTPFLLFFLNALQDAEGTMHTLYSLAVMLPGCGIVAAIASMCVVWGRRRKAVLIVDEHVRIPRSGVSFAFEDLNTVQLWSDQKSGSFAALLPNHIEERANVTGVHSVQPYIVNFPRGAAPQPFELAEILLTKNPELNLDRLGRL